MIYDDLVYGKVEINEPIILDIIASPYMQRLKGIDQSGYFEQFFPGCTYKRFEHSVGVYLLLKKYGASLEEQISGLIHDISHGTFSHCLDYIFDEGDQKKQNHQDNIFEEFLRSTDIPQILKKYGLNVEYVLDDSRHLLKENNLPDICADRIDYSLRTLFHFDKKPTTDILDHLKINDQIWFFDNFEYAKSFAEMFKRINDTYFSNIETAIMFQTVGDLFRYAWKNGYVQKDDFYTTDAQILNKVKQYLDKDEEIYLYRQRMNNIIKCKNNPDDFDAHIFCKNRIVDPFFEYNGKLLRVSELDNDWKETIKNKNQAKEYFLKFDK